MNIGKRFEAAEKHRKASRFPSAEQDYRAILKSPRLSLLDRAEAHLGAADVCRLQGRFCASLSDYQKASRLYRQVHSPRLVDAQMGFALALRAVGQPHQALSLLNKAFRHYRDDGDPEGLAFAHWALGGTYRIAGDPTRGWTALKAAEAAYRKQHDAEGAAYTCCALGGLARMRCDLKASSFYYRQANTRMRARRDLFGTAYSYCGIGNVYRMRGNFAKAFKYFQRAEKLYARIGDIVSYAYTLWSMGTAFKMSGRLPEAARAFREAEGLFRKTGDTRGQVYTLLGAAELQILSGKKGDSIARLCAKASRLCKAGGFFWESIHIKAVRNPKSSKSFYRRAGSRFNPTEYPLNFP